MNMNNERVSRIDMMQSTVELGRGVERSLGKLIEHSVKQEMMNAELKNLVRLLLNKIMESDDISLTRDEGELIKRKVVELGVM